MTDLARHPVRRVIGFAVLFLLYQSAEGVGGRILHAPAVQAGLMLAALLAAWPVGHWLGFRGYAAYALDARRRSLLLVLGGLVVAAAVRLAALSIGLSAGWYSAGAPQSPDGFALALAGAALSTFVPSLAEDILTRGFWLKAAAIRWSGPVFIVASAAIFLANHIYRLEAGPLEWLRLFAFGLAYAAAAWRWQNLWAALGLHLGWNLTNAVLDLTLPLESLNPAATALLSAAAHIAIALVVLLLPARRENPTANHNL